MEAYHNVCVSAIDTILPLIFDNISLLKDKKITHLLSDMREDPFNPILIDVNGFIPTSSGLYVILLFPTSVVEGYITFISTTIENFEYNLHIEIPHGQESLSYERATKFFTDRK